MLAYSFSIFFLVYRFFGEINNGTPFTNKNSRRLYFIGILVSLGPLLMITAYHFFTRWYLIRFQITFLDLKPDYRFNCWLFFLGLLILVIATAFRTGIELQEDQNLTV